MDDSADMGGDVDNGPEEVMNAAAARLRSALDRLEARISPMGDKVSELEKELKAAESFSADRAELAQRLDSVSAEAKTARDTLAEKERHFAAREQQFDKLADDTNAKIEAIIEQVTAAIGEG